MIKFHPKFIHRRWNEQKLREEMLCFCKPENGPAENARHMSMGGRYIQSFLPVGVQRF